MFPFLSQGKNVEFGFTNYVLLWGGVYVLNFLCPLMFKDPFTYSELESIF